MRLEGEAMYERIIRKKARNYLKELADSFWRHMQLLSHRIFLPKIVCKNVIKETLLQTLVLRF